MKTRLILFVVILSLIILLFACSGSSTNAVFDAKEESTSLDATSSITQDSSSLYGGHLVREITIENYTDYLTTSGTPAVGHGPEVNGIIQGNHSAMSIQFSPLLDCCLYENVFVTLLCSVWDVNDEKTVYTTEYRLHLRANGTGTFVINEKIPSGLQGFPYEDIYRCNRSLSIKAITGKIVF